MITNIIIIISAIIFVYINFISKEDKSSTALKLGAFYYPYIEEKHQYYRFITCNFIHIDFLHFFMNAYCLYSLGGFFESYLGTIDYLCLVFISMITSSLMTYSIAQISEKEKYIMSLGSSGIFYGYLGAIIALGVILKGAYFELLTEFIMVIVVNVVFTLITPSISKSGHLGGLLGGFISIVLLILVGRI